MTADNIFKVHQTLQLRKLEFLSRCSKSVAAHRIEPPTLPMVGVLQAWMDADSGHTYDTVHIPQAKQTPLEWLELFYSTEDLALKHGITNYLCQPSLSLKGKITYGEVQAEVSS